MTREKRPDSALHSDPTLAELIREAAVVPVEVVPRTEYRELLPSIGDICAQVPPDVEPEWEVPTAPLPMRHRTSRPPRRNGAIRAMVAAVAVVSGTSTALAAWMTPPPMSETSASPPVVGSTRIGVDTAALSLAVSEQALSRIMPAFAAIDEPVSASSPAKRPPRVDPAPAESEPASEFDPAAASSALDRAAMGAGECRSSGDPTGVVRAIVTFAPSGRVTRATVNGPPFAGTATGGCIARSLRTATVPPFEGDHVTVAKTMVIY